MRIAIINERWTAGATRCARDLQRGLAERHAERYFPEGDEKTPSDHLRGLADFRPDVVHLHSFYGDLPYDFLSEVAKRYPTIFTPHDPRPIGDIMLKCWSCNEFETCFKCPLIGTLKRYSLFRHDYFHRRRQKRKVHAQLPANTTIVCVSEWMRSRVMRSELGRLNVLRIHNGVDLELFKPVPDARAELGISATTPVLTFVAHHSGWTTDERKGGHILAKALAEVVVPNIPDLVVLAVGGGMIPNLPNVRPIGYVGPDKLARYYSAADVFVAPSLADNLPYTILEAMGCGVPVVATRTGGIPEEIDDNVTGCLVPTGSWQELGGALVALLKDQIRAAAMGQAGRKKAIEQFSLGAFVQNYTTLYRSVAGSPAV